MLTLQYSTFNDALLTTFYDVSVTLYLSTFLSVAVPGLGASDLDEDLFRKLFAVLRQLDAEFFRQNVIDGHPFGPNFFL